jgi:hypothetical protein
MNKKAVILAISGFCAMFVWGVNQNINYPTGTVNASNIMGISTAHAYNSNRGVARRTARRTAKRVSRRHANYHTLPTSCTKVIMNGELHHFCGGIYYKEIVEEKEPVFIIITP